MPEPESVVLNPLQVAVTEERSTASLKGILRKIFCCMSIVGDYDDSAPREATVINHGRSELVHNTFDDIDQHRTQEFTESYASEPSNSGGKRDRRASAMF